MDNVVVAPATAPGRLGLYLRWTARGVVIAIAAFWLWFGIADGLYDARSAGPMGLIMMLPAALVCLVTLYVVWRWELYGGLLLLAVAVLGSVLYFENMQHMSLQGAARIGQAAIGLGIFVLPFVIPAVLLLFKCGLDRRHRVVAD